uniref:Fibrinogen C-terminal domain-containing protein n=2 Tax=Amphimedon queenslandica TaxID=400682 RepID=A0A1X7UXV5_AMPQE
MFVFLLLVILCLLLVLLSAKDANCTCTTTAGAISGNFVLPNFTEWSDNLVNKLDHSFPDFNEWVNGVVSKVNSNVTQSLPDFKEWANGAASIVNSNVTQSHPDFTEWANGVVSKVNSNVTQSLPNFNEWANGVASIVNSNVTQSLPDFNEWVNGVSLPDFTEWANGVVSKVNSNVTQSLPDFNEWANGVVSKVNSSVTQSLPNFDEWANGVASIVTGNVTQSLPNLNEWANGVVSKVNSNVTQSLPDFTEWANGVVSKVNSNVTQSLPDFNEWANGVVSKVNGNVTQSLPNFNEWVNGVVSKVNSNVTQSLPDFDEWANGIVSKVNSNVTQSLPDFDEWANDIVFDVTSNTTQNLPKFNEWVNGVVSKVNSNVTQSLPDFNEWADGVAQNTFQLLQSSPNFTELNEQILQTTRNSTAKLMDIVDTLSNLEVTSISTAGVVDDILLIAQELLLVLHNESTTLPTSCKEIKERQPLSPSGIADTTYHQQLYTSDPLWDGQGCGFRETPCCNAPGIPWFHRDYGSITTTDYIELRVCGDEGTANEDNPANGIVSKVNSNVTQSLPDFKEWANGVAFKVNSNVTQSLPNFDEWANGIVFDVARNITQNLPSFNEWANGVVSKVNSNVIQSLPDFNEWANGVAQNTFQLLQSSPNLTELNEQILQTTRNSTAKLMDIVDTLSNLENTSTSTAGVVDDILLIAQELLVLHNKSTALNLPTSCKEIKERQLLSPSGVYLLSNTSSTYTAYCNMEELCNSNGGWTRLAYLDMTDSTVNCPSGFRLYQSGGVRACGRPVTSSGSCVSVQFPSNGISYSQVCGRVTGYQYSSPDAVDNVLVSNSYHNNLNSYYVDGVSITSGSPRQHIWTLMAANYEQFGVGDGRHVCPCATGSTQSVQSFVSDHYFCESGISDTIKYQQQLYTSDPLWDGQGCGFREAPCCNAPGIP